VQAKWTDQILDEAMAALQKSRPTIPMEKIRRLRELMIEAVEDCMISGYEPLIDGLTLRDPEDRHVLAAAIKAGAQVIVTADKDFTEESLAPWGIEAKHPDDFILDQLDINDRVVWACVQQIADGWQNPPGTVDDVLAKLERSGLVRSAAALRQNWGPQS
jgi:predicted nucleic acid-binding protein